MRLVFDLIVYDIYLCTAEQARAQEEEAYKKERKHVKEQRKIAEEERRRMKEFEQNLVLAKFNSQS